MKRKVRLGLVGVASGCALLLAGCADGGDGDDRKAKPTKDSAAGDAQGAPTGEESSTEGTVLATAKDGDVTVTVTSANRDQGGFVTLTGSLTNNGSRAWYAEDWQSAETELASNGVSMAGASLVDEEGKKRYLVLRDTNGRCLCTKFSRVAAGESADWYAQFPAPAEDATEVKFQVGSMPPATVQLSAGE
ncbi:hypothetical protein [Streptomyces sp. UH6]|uniref:hypothetical protein n=1 Tax=Streptomyces sp. UH6 TaxID=2748379 RepID=UPI0015D496FA|nr:hypothetical protein [Streptomyces sp. UH6]NYV74481.1 hypothetical protein [Streptomyces sp. UH6]